MTQTSAPKSPVRSTSRRSDPVRTYLRSARLLTFAYAAVGISAVLLPLPFPWREPLWLASGAVCFVLGGQLARVARDSDGSWLAAAGCW